jgi:pyruvate dehydrogenase E2 component (dihydrolipoamide acetyltransferase)
MLKTLQLVLRRFADLPPHTKLGMPSLSPTMTTGTIVKWLKKEGEKVKAGENMFEVETDKATVAFEVQDDVFLAKILAKEGSPPLPLGAPVAILVDKSDRVQAFQSYKEDEQVAEKKEKQVEEKKATGNEISFKMSPSAQRLIHSQKIDPSKIQPTGPKGHILKEDVINFVQNKGSDKNRESEKNRDMVQQKTVDMVQEGKNKTQDLDNRTEVRAPRFSVTTFINLEKPLSLFPESDLKSFLIKAASNSCKQIPEANSKFFPTFTRFYDYVDTQVYVYGSKSVQKYFLQDTERRSISEISNVLKAESSGPANFEISFGNEAYEVANPRTSSLLSLGHVQSQVVSAGDSLKSVRVIKATLNCDHRAVDGAVGANWLKSFKQFVENPVSLI